MSSSFRLICLAAVSMVLAAVSTHAATILIKADGTGAAATIQAGVDAAAPADTVLLAPGTYTGVGNRDVDFKGKAITITSQDGRAVTIVNCQGLGRGFIFNSGEVQTSVLSGLTIKNGTAYEGGAVYAHIAKPTILDNIISYNTATKDGGGVFVYGAVTTTVPARIAGNIFRGNSTIGDLANYRGGGLWVNSTAITIEDNTFSLNSANDGAGIWLSGSADNILRNNVFKNNTAEQKGGGVYISGFGPTIENNTIHDNTAEFQGGGMYVRGLTSAIEHCVIVNNTADLIGGAIYFAFGTPTLRNCTLAGNIGNGAIIGFGTELAIEKTIIAFHNTGAMYCYNGSVVTTSCSDLFGNTDNSLCGIDGGYNFSSDPLFCGPPDDFNISIESWCMAANSPCGELVGALPECVPSGVGDDLPKARGDLHQNYPNPFNPTTTFRYEIVGDGGEVTLAVFDVDGRLIVALVDERQTPGVKHVTWNGTNGAGERVSSGVYFYRLTAPGIRQVRKLTILK